MAGRSQRTSVRASTHSPRLASPRLALQHDKRLLLNGTLYMDVATAGDSANGTLFVHNSLGVDLTIVNASLFVYVCANETVTGECVDDACQCEIGSR